MRPPPLHPHQDRSLVTRVVHPASAGCIPPSSGSVKESGPKGGRHSGQVPAALRLSKRPGPCYQGKPGLQEPATEGRSRGHSSPKSSASFRWQLHEGPLPFAGLPFRKADLLCSPPPPVLSLLVRGWSWRITGRPLGSLPQGLPAVLFHVVLGTFTLEGGDEEC